MRSDSVSSPLDLESFRWYSIFNWRSGIAQNQWSMKEKSLQIADINLKIGIAYLLALITAILGYIAFYK